MHTIGFFVSLVVGLVNGNAITCDAPYGCAGHNIDTMTCNNDEICEITCSDEFACRDLDIYGPESTNTDTTQRLSLTIDCTAKYACYGAKLHTNNLDTIKVTCSDFWSCAYMTIEGQTANQVLVYVPEEGYYSFGSGTVYCPMNLDNDNDNNDNEVINTEEIISCSVECGGDRSCYHSKFHNHNGMIDNSLVIGCNGELSCNYAKLKCNYDSSLQEWTNECIMSCDDNDQNCACDELHECMINKDEQDDD